MARDKNQLFVTVPTLFRCPISMDVMKSPVSLCTGVTYDRASIKTWLDSGHNTCPATMQVLHSTDVIPNLTLRSLIRSWSESSLVSTVTKHQILDSIHNIINRSSGNYFNALTKILEFAKFSDENKEFLANYDGFVPAIVEIMCGVTDIKVVEMLVSVLDLMITESKVKQILRSNAICLSQFVLVFQKGNLESKIVAANILTSISTDEKSQRQAIQTKGLVAELVNFISSENDPNAIKAALSALITVSVSRTAKIELIRLGIVRIGSEILSNVGDQYVFVIEKVMHVLELVSSVTEGRAAICSDERCVVEVVNKLMKVSALATEHGVGVVHSVCYLARDWKAVDAAIKSNGLTNVLLVMQSNCSMRVRQMCGDLVKVFRVNSKSSLLSYVTRSSHIMPY